MAHLHDKVLEINGSIVLGEFSVTTLHVEGGQHIYP